jgi:hypothetical protein
MTDNVENLLLEHLKRFQGTLDRVERKIDELTRRTSILVIGQASIIQHIGHLATADAQQQVTADNFNRRLERIERRLELSETLIRP